MLLLQVGDKPFRRVGDGDDLLRRGINRAQVHGEIDALEHLAHTPYDIVFIDLDLPGVSGPSLVSAIRRARFTLPIFAFTTRVDVAAKIKVLDLGADDVLTTLCPMDELLARVRAVLRRLAGQASSALEFGPLEVLMDAREVRVSGTPVPLTRTEYLMVEFLVRKQGAPVTKEACLSYLYAGRDEPDAKTIDVLTCRVRKKLQAAGAGNVIKNIWGHGLKLELQPPRSAALDSNGRRSTDAPQERRRIQRKVSAARTPVDAVAAAERCA